MRVLVFIALGLFASPVWATSQDEVAARLMAALKMPEVVQILADEGMGAASNIADGLFPGRGGSGWEADVARIYRPDRHLDAVQADMADIIGDADLGDMLVFLESPAGQKVMELELTARRAFSSEDVEAAARDIWSDGKKSAPDHDQLVRTFIDVNNLVSSNVEGAAKANVAFALGLIDGGAFPNSRPEALAEELYGDPASMTEDTFGWLYAYLMTAYAPLTEDELSTYVALSETEGGAVLNAAIMGSFDELFTRISYDLGLAAAAIMIQTDL